MKNIKYFLPFILAAIILMLLNSCSVHKKVEKKDTKESVTSDTQVTLTRTVTETADTLITIPESTITVEAELNRLLKGDTITQDTPEEKITTELTKGIVKTQVVFKPKSVPFKVNKRSVEAFHGDTKVKAYIEVKEKAKDVERSGLNLNWLWLLLALILAFLAWRFLGFRKKTD